MPGTPVLLLSQKVRRLYENKTFYKKLSKLSSWSLCGITDYEKDKGVFLRLIFFIKMLNQERIRALAYVILCSVKPVGRHSYPRS